MNLRSSPTFSETTSRLFSKNLLIKGISLMSEPTLKAPLTINWALNNSCNFSCRHCYSRVDTGDELDGATLKDCLTRCAKAGVMAVNFGGGEPLLRCDLLEIA